MTEPHRVAGRPTPVRVTGLILLAVLLLGCGSTQDPEPTPSSASSGTPGPGGPAVAQPPRDTESVTRAGPVETRTAKCVLDTEPEWAFDGTVTAIDDGRVTFEVHESFGGSDLPARRTVVMGAPVTPDRSEASPSYSVGDRLLVSGSGVTAWGCGRTVYYDEATAAGWRS